MVDYDKEGERITVNLDQKLDVRIDHINDVFSQFNTYSQKGEYQLVLKFVGEINNRMRGFYRTKYTTPDGKETRYGASTQFEVRLIYAISKTRVYSTFFQPADCRRAFPCWDEPNFKATFDITLITPKHLRAISNMVCQFTLDQSDKLIRNFTFQPIKSEEEFAENKEWKVTKFDRTPIMSTYLVAYVVGEYDYVETKDSNGVSMRVYTPVGKKEHGQFALDVCFMNLCRRIVRGLNYLSFPNRPQRRFCRSMLITSISNIPSLKPIKLPSPTLPWGKE